MVLADNVQFGMFAGVASPKTLGPKRYRQTPAVWVPFSFSSEIKTKI